MVNYKRYKVKYDLAEGYRFNLATCYTKKKKGVKVSPLQTPLPKCSI